MRQKKIGTFLFQPQLSQARSLETGMGPGAVFRPSLPTLLPEGRAESKADAARKVLGTGNYRVSGRRVRGGGGKWWPPEPAQESPTLGAVPTHLSREVIARTAGRGALGGLAIPGGSSARRARHISGREVSWGSRRARDSAATAPP